MTDGQLGSGGTGGGFEGAKAQRNLLERLMAKIPGFAGFADRELRRDVDKLQRERMASEVQRAKGLLRESARAYTDAGKIGVLDRFERLDRRFDKLGESIRFADYGVSGLFDPVKIDESALARLYAHDLALLGDLEGLEGATAALPAPDAGGAEAALDALLAQLRAIEARWGERETVISDVVRASR